MSELNFKGHGKTGEEPSYLIIELLCGCRIPEGLCSIDLRGKVCLADWISDYKTMPHLSQCKEDCFLFYQIWLIVITREGTYFLKHSCPTLRQ